MQPTNEHVAHHLHDDYHARMRLFLLLIVIMVFGLLTACAQPEPTATLTVAPTPVPTATPIPPPDASPVADPRRGSAPLLVSFANTSPGPVTTWEWDFGDGSTSTEQDPAHQYTRAGTYIVRLTVSGPGGSDVATLKEIITISPGPLAGLVTPTPITLQVQRTTRLGAAAVDQFGNEIGDVELTWTVPAPLATIDATGLLTAGTEAGTHARLVKVTATQGEQTREASVDVTITPGPLATVTVEPAEVTLDIGESQPFTFTAFDAFGNRVTDVIAGWTAGGGVGNVGIDGLLTTGTKAGSFHSAIRVDVAQGTVRASATANVSIRPDPLATVEIEPSFAVIERRSIQQFTAVGFDQYRNEIPGLAFLWASEGGGTTQEGLYTASAPGSFSVTASAMFRADERTGAAVADVPLVAHWPGNGNADDVAGGHHGALRGGATFAPGIEGQAFSLRQAGAYVEVVFGNDDFNFEPTQPMTIDLWAKRTFPAGPLPTGLSMHLLGKRTQCRDRQEDIHYQMHYEWDDWRFGSGGGGVWEQTATVDPLPFDQWRHLAVTFDGFDFRFYIDGVLKVGPRFGTFQLPNNVPLIIGGSGGCSTFIGLIDEVRIYNRALSAEEVRARYDAG